MAAPKRKKMTAAADARMDKRMGIKPGSKADQAMDKKMGVKREKKGY